MEVYISEKIKLLKQFKINLTVEEWLTLASQKTEIAVDNVVRTILKKHLGVL